MAAAEVDAVGQAEPILRVDALKVYFPVQRGVHKRTVGHVHAVDAVFFELVQGRTLGLVGESGCPVAASRSWARRSHAYTESVRLLDVVRIPEAAQRMEDCPAHPYTYGRRVRSQRRRSVPRQGWESAEGKTPLHEIPGTVPSLVSLPPPTLGPPGCAFAARGPKKDTRSRCTDGYTSVTACYPPPTDGRSFSERRVRPRRPTRWRRSPRFGRAAFERRPGTSAPIRSRSAGKWDCCTTRR